MQSSCFNCILLQDTPNKEYRDRAYVCGYYGHVMSYDQARVPNNCSAKRQDDNILQFPQNPILENLYRSCVELAYYIERPFTIRELVDHVNYHNKNSLWMLMEQLVQIGRIEKADVNTENHRGQRYKAKVYFPTDWSSYDDIANTSENTLQLLREDA